MPFNKGERGLDSLDNFFQLRAEAWGCCQHSDGSAPAHTFHDQASQPQYGVGDGCSLEEKLLSYMLIVFMAASSTLSLDGRSSYIDSQRCPRRTT